MKLRGIDFGPCLDASGVRGFFGEGYWFHPILQPLGLNFSGSTFVSKTTTFFPNTGNMPMIKNRRSFVPSEWFPKCIWMSRREQIALNAVGLSGPGAKTLFEMGLLKRSGPFMISFMPVGNSPQKRAAECFSFTELLFDTLSAMSELPQVGLQINISCPNTGHDTKKIIKEALVFLNITKALDIPLMVKINLLVPINAMKAIADHPECDAICLTNTLPFGELPASVPWEKLFPNGSPLKEFGGGGLSGEPLFRLVVEYVDEARQRGINIPFNAGGGILKPNNVDTLVEAGLKRGRDSIFVGSVAMLRPWRVRGVINRAHQRLGG